MQKSVIDRLEDMPRKPDLQIVVNKGLNPFLLIKSSYTKKFFGKFEKSEENPRIFLEDF